MTHVPTESFFSSGNASAVRRSGGSSSSANARSSRSSTAREPLREGAIRNRENLVVSNREIRQLFDTMKELGDCVRAQNAKLGTMSVKLEDACKEVNELKTQLKTVLDRDSRASEKEATHRGPVPKQLKGDVHLLHNKQEIDQQFHGNEGIDSAHNSAVRSFLCKELQKEDNGYEKSAIMRAVSRYYETKRQQYLDNLPARKNSAEKRQMEKKLTSRRRRLFIKRMKVASGSEKQALLQLDPSFMSDEEDGEEGEAGSWIVRSPSWRSPELTSLVKRLQGKVEAQSGSSHPKNKRLHGEPSTRSSPPLSPAWALGTLDRDNHPRSPSPQPLSPFPDAPHSLQRPRAAFSSEEDEDSESGDEYRVLDHVDSPVNRRRNKRVRPLND